MAKTANGNPSLDELTLSIKNTEVQIPISRSVPLIYTPTGTWVKALVASQDFLDDQFPSASAWKRILRTAASSLGIERALEAYWRDPKTPKEGELVYAEAGSQNGVLGLLDISKDLTQGFPPFMRTNGMYDRDEETRAITAVYLLPQYVFGAAYRGSLDELLKNPNIGKR